MATFKNTTDHAIDIPLYDLHLEPGAVFEVPDEVAASFESNPDFASSRSKHPDVVVDPAITESSVAGGDAINPLSPAVAPAAPPTA